VGGAEPVLEGVQVGAARVANPGSMASPWPGGKVTMSCGAWYPIHMTADVGRASMAVACFTIRSARARSPWLPPTLRKPAPVPGTQVTMLRAVSGFPMATMALPLLAGSNPSRYARGWRLQHQQRRVGQRHQDAHA
jgi:hypothetical protein